MTGDVVLAASLLASLGSRTCMPRLASQSCSCLCFYRLSCRQRVRVRWRHHVDFPGLFLSVCILQSQTETSREIRGVRQRDSKSSPGTRYHPLVPKEHSNRAQEARTSHVATRDNNQANWHQNSTGSHCHHACCSYTFCSTSHVYEPNYQLAVQHTQQPDEAFPADTERNASMRMPGPKHFDEPTRGKHISKQLPCSTWLWLSRIGTQNGTLANGNMDSNLWSPVGLILTHTDMYIVLRI